MNGLIFQVVFSILIIVVAVIYFRQSRASGDKTSGKQMSLAIFQILLCGYFFSLCLSDFMDIAVNFSLERCVINVFADIAFLFLTIYILFHNRKESDTYFKALIWSAIVYIGVQCFIFPYRTEFGFMRVFEAVEGAVVYGLLIVFVLNIRNMDFGQKSLWIIVVLETLVAVLNVIVPIESITGDPEIGDILLNYEALFVRPILFASIALAYRVWMDRHVPGAAGTRH